MPGDTAHELPLPLGTVPDWRPLVEWYLSRFASDGVLPSDVNQLESWSANATAFDATGSWRARIIGGALWVKPLRFHAHWAERSSILRMVLLALRSGPLPVDIDLVYGHADNDNTPSIRLGRCRRDQPSCVSHRKLPLFTNSHNPRQGGLPMPEFTWIGWQKAPPWCRQARRLDAAALVAPWRTRDPRLFFSGGLDNGHHRKELRKLALAEKAAGRTTELHVRDVSSKFHRWAQFDLLQPDGVNHTVTIAARPVPQSAACGHQYSINVPGFGYSSRLRSLLRCGNAVVHVAHSSSEFFMPRALLCRPCQCRCDRCHHST